MARRIIINLLHANPGAFPDSITRMMIEALEALDYNEVLPILQPVRGGRKVGFREQRICLRALAIIKYRQAMGTKKRAAIEAVADAFGVSFDTVRSWEYRLKKELGHLKVARALSSAKLVADQEKNARREVNRGEEALMAPMLGMGEQFYGRAALEQLGREFKSAQRPMRG